MEAKMAWLAWGLMWVGVSAAVGLAVYITGSGMPLWAFLIPGSISFKTSPDKASADQ